MGDMSGPRGVRRACPVGSDLGRANPGDMSIFCANELVGGRTTGHAHSSAGHAHCSGQGVGIWGICPGPGCAEGMSRGL